AERIALIRAGLVACISHERDIEVVAELDRPEPVVPTVSSLRPDVVVIDDDIACPDGFAVIQALHTTTPSCHTLIMATRPYPRAPRRAVGARATGFVRKNSPREDISKAIRRAAKGMRAVAPGLAFATLDAAATPMPPRECDVLRLAAEGAPTAE